MADGKDLGAAAAAEPDPDEGQPDLEEEGELEAAAGGGGEEEEDVDVDGLASFLEFEILSGSSEEDPLDLEEGEEEKETGVSDEAKNGKRKQDSLSDGDGSGSEDEHQKRARREKGKGKVLAEGPPQIDTGMFTNVPPELFLQIFKFLSSEDLISCALVCRFMNAAASDETLWRRLYCMRWGLSSNATSNAKLRECAWKSLYIQQDREDMVEFVRYTPTEFKEYYIQMQAAKRSQAPLPSEVITDLLALLSLFSV
ncbi:hypothetical protein ACQJBY_069797 [Aegilops geniculata]